MPAVMQEPKMLEDVTGLTEMKEAAAKADAEMDETWPEGSEDQEDEDWATI